jgi:hypothetical protein
MQDAQTPIGQKLLGYKSGALPSASEKKVEGKRALGKN